MPAFVCHYKMIPRADRPVHQYPAFTINVGALPVMDINLNNFAYDAYSEGYLNCLRDSEMRSTTQETKMLSVQIQSIQLPPNLELAFLPGKYRLTPEQLLNIHILPNLLHWPYQAITDNIDISQHDSEFFKTHFQEELSMRQRVIPKFIIHEDWT